MKRALAALAGALASGVIFGAGLAISHMTKPQKIKDFLDVAAIGAGGWDPSLLFVMGSALVIAFLGLRLDRLMRAPLAAPAFIRSGRTVVDGQLVAGAAIFGLGWGLAGLCPGPAIADLGLVPDVILPFVGAMLVGSWLTGEAMAQLPDRHADALAPNAAAE